MQDRSSLAFLLIMLCTFVGCSGGEEEQTTQLAPPFTAEVVADGFEQMCTNDREAMEKRQAEATLYERVGGREGLRAVVEDTLQRYLANPDLEHLLEGVDSERLAKWATDYLVVATGGEGEYEGPDVVEAVARLEATDEEFIAAADDFREAMNAAGWDEFEHQEMFCVFVGLRGEANAGQRSG